MRSRGSAVRGVFVENRADAIVGGHSQGVSHKRRWDKSVELEAQSANGVIKPEAWCAPSHTRKEAQFKPPV